METETEQALIVRRLPWWWLSRGVGGMELAGAARMEVRVRDGGDAEPR